MSGADLIGGETRTPSILIIVYCCMHHRGQIDHYTLDDLELSQLAYAIDQVPGTRSYLAKIYGSRNADVCRCMPEAHSSRSYAVNNEEGSGKSTRSCFVN
jgi:hypothetical protein